MNTYAVQPLLPQYTAQAPVLCYAITLRRADDGGFYLPELASFEYENVTDGFFSWFEPFASTIPFQVRYVFTVGDEHMSRN